VARYVIGADGSHSAVRSAIGLEFRGETYDSQFVMADVELEYPGSVDDEATITMSSHGVTVIARLPSGNHRMIATVAAGAEVPDAPDAAFVDALLRERGVGAQSASEPAWASRFRSTTRSPTGSVSTGCSSPVTPPTCTARRRGRA
jgi:2-polyprenyl-6-methoxyphenol hydroxylase-like FAD-dependent oxidoreductase